MTGDIPKGHTKIPQPHGGKDAQASLHPPWLWWGAAPTLRPELPVTGSLDVCHEPVMIRCSRGNSGDGKRWHGMLVHFSVPMETVPGRDDGDVSSAYVWATELDDFHRPFYLFIYCFGSRNSKSAFSVRHPCCVPSLRMAQCSEDVKQVRAGLRFGFLRTQSRRASDLPPHPGASAPHRAGVRWGAQTCAGSGGGGGASPGGAGPEAGAALGTWCFRAA